ncbi:hypothetical protein Spb1_29850 [Planctopirus ephydatiae]|uniref:Uncharacterized protein n=1 Tax=Planctopirus ephydatiae TaxID=2528019 RepID=A0A518GR16_9PLAN|nr:hypothetical protein [Planctopirus ephydatiae]QDV31048.1 hypothetical protein Spb1_29850 [Planctopirus ephydatiae]
MDELEASMAAASSTFVPLSCLARHSKGEVSDVTDFVSLVESRKHWIQQVLRPWCRSAPVTELRLAALNWVDLAGQISPDATLWPWAWERFEGVIHTELGFDESRQWKVSLRNGSEASGYINGRLSRGEQIVLVYRDSHSEQLTTTSPIGLDEISSIRSLEPNPRSE